MKKLLIFVEGQTEERFCKELLLPFFEIKKIFLQPILSTTKIVKDGTNFRGGLGSYSKIKKELLMLLGDTSATAVSTMLDYYGLPKHFPGRSNPEGQSSLERVKFVEKALYDDINNEKFIPFLTLHEFESLLFSSPKDIAEGLPGIYNLEKKLQEIRQQFTSPEEINDQPSTAPHQRILNLYSAYRKPTFGVSIASRIGLQRIRENCPHFSSWIAYLEQI